MTFSTLLGHEKTLTFLERTVAEGRPAHGYLFTGPDGVGKRLVAKRFACMLNCRRPVDDRQGACSACRRIEAEQHPDFLVERPEKDSIRIDRIRQIRSFFQYAPVEAAYRVCVVDDAHKMNRSAQNALLKTLEEPPAGRVLILVTSKPALLLPTVRSRCRRIRFAPLPQKDLADLLQHEGVAADRAAVLASMASGSISRAREMNEPKFLSLRERILAVLVEPGRVGIAGGLGLSAEISGDRRTAQDAIEIACAWIRDVALAKAGSQTAPPIHRDFLDRIDSAAQHLDSGQLFAVYDELTEASDLIDAAMNANRTLVSDVMIFRILRLLAGPTLGVAAS
jgi:DNA polymerase III subunit delta'